jgi:hypothetical protein
MKKLTVLIVLMIAVGYQAFGQSDIYQKKIKILTQMRTGGYVMLGVGAGLVTAGAVALISLPPDFWNDTDEYDEDGDILGDLGHDIMLDAIICVMGVGVGLVAGGITMSSVSNRKLKLYQGKASDVSLNFNVIPGNQGMRLVYRF